MFSTLQGVVGFRRDIDGRIAVAGALAVYLLVVAVPRVMFGVDIWPALGVPTGPSPFFDTRNVTAALECHRLGFDPLVANPCDPWDRPMNYPRVWLALRWLGLDQSDTTFLALAFIGLFLTSVFLVVGRISLGEGLLVALAVCSPAVMFAVERANMDIVIFSFLALAVLAWRRPRPWSDILSPSIVLIAATAKIYPVFALAAYPLTRRRLAVLMSILCGAAFVLYAALTLADIQAVARTAPQGQLHSFGARILIAALYHQFVPDRWAGTIAKQLAAILPFVVMVPVLWVWGRRRRPSHRVPIVGASLVAFYFGALLFIGTFAIANNFDYRLVFLLFTLPQLFRWVSEGTADPRGRLAGLTLVVILALLWVGALSGPLRLGDELVSWAAAALLVVLTIAAMPPLRIRGVFSRRSFSTSEGP